MPGKKWRCFRKNLAYEADYLLRKFKIFQALIFLVSLIAIVITGFGDTTSFFIGETSPIPNEWTWLKNRKFTHIISVLIIAIPYFIVWINDLINQSKEYSDLSDLVQENVIPRIQDELKSLKKSIKCKFHISDNIRLSIFVPVRTGVFNWQLQMVCKTDNVPDKELMASFQLDEGVLGYTFLKTKKHHIEFIDVCDLNKLPSTYIPLKSDNYNLINREIKGVIVISAFQNGSIAGLLAIDTDNLSNLNVMEEYKLHSDALDWIIARSKAIKWIWRMKNNV
ncbi:hypothetical protein SD81_006985 [Tolypothrix campylonemoides VB511288]|nr:hypothetical protein SD81_006985 [Tolypothrix campylonemoides VB511288]